MNHLLGAGKQLQQLITQLSDLKLERAVCSTYSLPCITSAVLPLDEPLAKTNIAFVTGVLLPIL